MARPHALLAVLLLACLLPTARSQDRLQGLRAAAAPYLAGLPTNATPPQAAPTTVQSQVADAAQSQVIINELMSDNQNTVKDEDGATPSWVELLNTGSAPISLQGYKLTAEKDTSKAWALPAITLGAGQFLLVYLDSKNLVDPSKPLHADFKINKEDMYLALLAPTDAVASAVDFPMLKADQSFGVVGAAGMVIAQVRQSAPVYAPLTIPTPGRPNSGASSGGPLVIRTTQSPTPQPDASRDIVVSATVQPVQSPVTGASLVYVVGYSTETVVPMTENLYGTFSAVIPASQLTPGALVRWFVKATDSQGGVTRDPPFAKPMDRQYYGTIIADPSDKSNLFVLDMYCPLDNAPVNQTATPGCSLLINGTFYDNVEISRRGVTSLQWPKPKIKIAAKQGEVFKIIKGWHRVKEFNLNSEWAEPGENSFMREPLVWKTFREAGVESLVSINMHVRFNGKYYGKFAFSEQIDTDSLKGWGYDTTNVGPLWKSTSGEFSNLRWDVPPNNIQYYWKKYTRKSTNDDQALLDFARGLSGGGRVVRSKYLFDAINLPQVVNHMAAQTMILNQDRCTKNFWIYLDPTSQQWSMFPWDVESGFGIDRGLGGQPAPDYCILACEQWNSPLYCDHNHPQDLAVKTPWGLISAQYPTWNTQGGRRLQGVGCSGSGSSDPLVWAARKILQSGPGGAGPSVALVERNAGAPANGADLAVQQLPVNSTIGPDYDVDKTKQGPTTTGAPGTYNYLIDAILAVPRTRQMYMRRLRSLMDQFIATGRLESIVREMYPQIRDEAKRDAAKWQNPGDPDRGFQQLIIEQLPIRKDQLYNTYGPKGSIPLIPDAQPAGPKLQLGKSEAGDGGYVGVVNPNDFAVDISGYSLGGAVKFVFRAGTVVPAQDSVFVAANINSFKQRSTSPKGGEGRFVVGPFSGQVLGPGASVSLSDWQGNMVAST